MPMLCFLLSLVGISSSAGAESARIVSLELVLAIDVSASVDAAEYRLQIQGLADAFRQPKVVDAILQHQDGVAVTLVQWGSQAQGVLAPPWRLLDSRDAVLNFAAEIETSSRRRVGPLTAIGQAIELSIDLLEANPYQGLRRRIDVSGDGQNNAGLPVVRARQRALSKDITINGLAILTDEPTLFDYYQRQVVGGPGAFALQTNDYAGFAAAMARKLFLELTVQIASSPRHQHASSSSNAFATFRSAVSNPSVNQL